MTDLQTVIRDQRQLLDREEALSRRLNGNLSPRDVETIVAWTRSKAAERAYKQRTYLARIGRGEVADRELDRSVGIQKSISRAQDELMACSAWTRDRPDW